MLVKASIAVAIVTNTLFMLGASFLLGGLKHYIQEYNRVSARMQAGMLFLATIALLIPSTMIEVDSAAGAKSSQTLSLGLALLLIVAYALGTLFSLKTHREDFASVAHGEDGEVPWPIVLALGTLAGVTVPAANSLSRSATAVLVFQKITKAGLRIGAQYGDGVLFRGDKVAGFYNTKGASYGLQAGAQQFGYAMFLMNEKAVSALGANDGFEVGVGPSVVVMDEG
jgi:hypothetical protein